jgi:hypothetical protein
VPVDLRQAFQRQVFVVLDSNFWDIVQQALVGIQSNQSYTGLVPFTFDYAAE